MDWVITYDDCPEILKLYRNHACKRVSWSYSAAIKRKVNEIMIFGNTAMIPTKEELQSRKIRTTLHDIYDISEKQRDEASFMGLKLVSVNIENFRSFRDVKFNTGRKITVISGQNGVGKSNLVSLPI